MTNHLNITGTTVDSFRDPTGEIDWEKISAASIRINHKSQVEPEDLDRIRKELAGNDLAIRSIGSFLKYANKLLVSAESLRASFGDRAVAEVQFAGRSFIFTRL